MARPALGPDDRLMRAGDAARLLGVTVAAVRARCDRAEPSIRGLAPRSPHNPGREWLVSADDVEAALRPDRREAPPAPPGALSLGDADVQLEMLQGALTDEKDRRIAQLEDLLAAVRAEKDARIAQLETQLEVLGQSLAALTARPAAALPH